MSSIRSEALKGLVPENQDKIISEAKNGKNFDVVEYPSEMTDEIVHRFLERA